MIQTWPQALDAIYGLTNWETRPAGSALTFELDRIRELLERLGRPQDRWPAVQIGGTNGKGSTASMVAEVLGRSGMKVGLFSSPHLHTLRERVRVGGRPIAEAEVIAWLNRHAADLAGLPGLTTFEALTALAFDHFAAMGVDAGVVEVGLGGRLDTTAVLEPALCILTPIGLDHMAVLGPTVEAIASDKVGIFEAGRPVVSAPQRPEARAVIRRAAADLDCPLLEVEEAWISGVESSAEGGQRFELALPAMDGPGLAELGPTTLTVAIGLAGRFQRTNAATAALALRALQSLGWPVREEAILEGLAGAAWPARFERFSTDAVLGRPGPRLVIDGGHNQPAAEALAAALDEAYRGRARHLILGCSADKDIPNVIGPLLAGGAASVTTHRADHPRAMAAENLVEEVRRIDPSVPVHAAADAHAALDHALELAGPGDLIVATGSLFSAAAVRMAWAERGGLPVPESDPPA